MAWTGGRETLTMATFGHFFKNRRFGLHFAEGMGQKFEKKIFRGKPPVMSGEVYRCPMDSPELRGGLEKKVDKKSKFSERVRGGWGRSGGPLVYPRTLYRSTRPRSPPPCSLALTTRNKGVNYDCTRHDPSLPPCFSKTKNRGKKNTP